jgi:hypothetical protein
MHLISKLAVASILVSGPALAGIEISTPLVSGDVATFEKRHETSRRDLSHAQVEALSRWLGLHMSGWHGMITESSSEPVSLQFSLRDADRKTGALAVVASAHGGYYLQFTSSSQKWSYRSLGGLFKSWAATRALSPDELNQLQRTVGILEMPDRH